MVKAGPDAQEHADNIGQLLSNLEYTRMRAVLKAEELRTLYEMDCAEMGLVATALDLSELLKGIEEERKRRCRLVTAFLMERFDKKTSVADLEEAIRRKKYGLVYKVAAKEESMTRTLPEKGRKSPGYGHLGMWNVCLGPNSPLPGERLQVVILDETGQTVRRLEQIRGLCRDEGYVDFFGGPNCRPAVHDYPLVDIDVDGNVAAIVHSNYSQSLGQELYLKLVKAWAEKWGKPEYAL